MQTEFTAPYAERVTTSYAPSVNVCYYTSLLSSPSRAWQFLLVVAKVKEKNIYSALILCSDLGSNLSRNGRKAAINRLGYGTVNEDLSNCLIKLSLCLIKHYVTKAYGGVNV
jgi:hypothetical protein